VADTKENDSISDPDFPEDTKMAPLFEAAENIRDMFRPLAGTSPPNEVMAHAENSVRDDFKAVYCSLFAMAVAELEVRSRSAEGYFLSSVSYEFEEIAHIAAETPYSKRSRDNFLEITDLILRFFSEEANRTQEDLFLYLRGVTGKNLRQIQKKISSSEKKLLHYVYTAVTRHITYTPRYRRRGDIVTDLEGLESSSLRQVTIFEIVGICAPALRGKERPGELVEMIFNELLRKKDFARHVHISTLRLGVFELIKSRFISQPREITEIDPMQEYLQKEMLLLAGEALNETVATYHWRAEGSGEFMAEYKKAGRDILEEIIVHGSKIPHEEALGRHIAGCDENAYRTTHKGSFQNFWKVLWDNFLKKIRADI
jgi:hypothetical protein